MTTTYAADTFTRPDGQVGNAETGGAWTAAGAASTWGVASNQLTGQSNSVNGYEGLLTINDGQSDGAVQVTFVGGASVGLVFRYTSAKDYWVLTFGANNYIRLCYFNAGYTIKADPDAVAAIGDLFRVELTGPSIVVFRNGKQIISINDATRVTATSHGLLTGGRAVSTFDAFSHYSLTSTPAPNPTPTPTPTPVPAPTPTSTVHRYFNIGGVAVPVS